MKTALTIAGSDPTGGAGLQADLRVFQAHGVYGISIPAALTAQNTKGVEAVRPVDGEFLKRQLNCLLSDIKPDSVKTGMLYSKAAIMLVADAVRQFDLKNLVVDPVTVSSSGAALAEEGALDAIRDLLFPIARVITPNIYEASVLTGIQIDNAEDMQEAAKRLKSMGPECVVVTGGHLESIALDVFFDGESMLRVESEKISGEYHGTGCAFAAAVAAGLALGHTPIESVRAAKEFVRESIKHAFHPGSGMGIMKF